MTPLLPLLGLGSVLLFFVGKKGAKASAPLEPGVLETTGDESPAVPPFERGPDVVVQTPTGPQVVPTQVVHTPQGPMNVPIPASLPPLSSVSPGQPTGTATAAREAELAAIAKGMATAIQQGNPTGIRSYAAVLRRGGYPAQAAALEAIAAQLELAQAPTVPPVVSSPVPLPPIVPAAAIPSAPVFVPPPIVMQPAPTAPPGAEDPRKRVASDVVRNLMTHPAKGTEDQNMLKHYQAQEGLTPDGKYGPQTALTLIKYGHVPPTPRYWVGPPGATWNVAAPKRDYKNRLIAERNKDPVRVQEWEQAIAAVK